MFQNSELLRGLRIEWVVMACCCSIVFAVPASSAEISPNAPPEVPEEVLRAEIILDARSPLDGTRLTATEYAELRVAIEQANVVEPQVDPKLRNLIGLIKLRKLIKTLLPIVPIK